MDKKKLLLLSALMFSLIFAAGCVGKDGKVPGKRAVLKYVDSVCEEPYELVDVKQIAWEPDEVEYSFKTTERGIAFKANSFLDPVYIDASQTLFYTKEISCDYVKEVHRQYEEELEKVLSESELYIPEKGWLYLRSFSDIKALVSVVKKADLVYSEEMEYNSKEFLSENPLRSIHVIWIDDTESSEDPRSWTNITDVYITGQNDSGELYESLAELYAQLAADREIEDRGDIPRRYSDGKHVSVLETIYLNGEEMLYAEKENPYGYFLLDTYRYKFSWYSKELDSYMMAIDLGYIYDRGSFPLLIREYVKKLGGTYDLYSKKKTYVTEWQIGKDRYVMESKFARDSLESLRSLRFEKNGKELDIPYVTFKEDKELNGVFCVGITADDFCKLFGFTYAVDEENRTISFYSKEK